MSVPAACPAPGLRPPNSSRWGPPDPAAQGTRRAEHNFRRGSGSAADPHPTPTPSHGSAAQPGCPTDGAGLPPRREKGQGLQAGICPPQESSRGNSPRKSSNRTPSTACIRAGGRFGRGEGGTHSTSSTPGGHRAVTPRLCCFSHTAFCGCEREGLPARRAPSRASFPVSTAPTPVPTARRAGGS